jgi:probable dihydroxyacetone kinase regulator
MPDANITKSALAASMKKLMKEKPFAKISVIDICEGCGMNRKSFYYHFKDKYDLVNWIFYTDFISLVSTGNYTSGWELIVAVGELFYQDQEFYRSALKIEGQNSFRDYFHESMTPIVSFFLREDGEENGDTDREILITFFCDAYLSAVERWLEDGCRMTPEEFVNHLKSMILEMARKIMDEKI